MSGEITSEVIGAFVRTESLPLVIEFSHESAQKIFSGAIKDHLLLFAGKSSDSFAAIQDAARQTAKVFKGKASHVFIFLSFFSSRTEQRANDLKGRGFCCQTGCKKKFGLKPLFGSRN